MQNEPTRKHSSVLDSSRGLAGGDVVELLAKIERLESSAWISFVMSAAFLGGSIAAIESREVALIVPLVLGFLVSAGRLIGIFRLMTFCWRSASEVYVTYDLDF